MERSDGIRPLVYTTDEVMRLLRVGRTKLYEMVSRNEIPVRRAGRKLLFPRQSLHDWLETRHESEGDGG